MHHLSPPSEAPGTDGDGRPALAEAPATPLTSLPSLFDSGGNDE